jgi:hypothetical protein
MRKLKCNNFRFGTLGYLHAYNKPALFAWPNIVESTIALRFKVEDNRANSLILQIKLNL